MDEFTKKLLKENRRVVCLRIVRTNRLNRQAYINQPPAQGQQCGGVEIKTRNKRIWKILFCFEKSMGT